MKKNEISASPRNAEAIAELRKYYPSLPDNLTVGGSLDLRGTQITKLPDNLTVGGSLDLRGTQITKLPDNLTVGGYLDLSGTQITKLPDNLTVGGSLYLSGTQILSSENWVISGEIGSRNDNTSFDIVKDHVYCGCFTGTLEQFGQKVRASYKSGHKHRTEYDEFISLCKKAVAEMKGAKKAA